MANELNRYGHIAIEIDDESVRALPISGVFDAYDTESFVAFLSALPEVVVQRTSTRIHIFSRAPVPSEPRSDTR